MILLLIFSIFLNAKTKPPCTHEVITRNCDFFKERKNASFIEVKNGIGFTNPLYELDSPLVTIKVSPANTGNQTDSNMSYHQELENYFDSLLRSQSEVLDVLEGTTVSSKAKLSLSMQMHQIILNPDTAINISWPLSGKNSKVQAVSGKLIVQELKSIIGEAKFAEIAQISKQYQDSELLRLQNEQNKQIEERNRLEEFHIQKVKFASENKQRINVIFNKAKQSIIDIIKQGQNESELSDEKKLLINKVKLIQLNNLDEHAAAAACANNSDNAFYNPNHTVTLCPGSTTSTDEKLTLLLSHEISHSIDTCSSQMPLWKVDAEKLNQLLDDPTLSKAVRMEILLILKPDQKFLNYDPELIFSLKETTELLLDKKILTKMQDGISVSKYPFKKESECLVTENKFRSIEQKDISRTEEVFNYHTEDEKDNATFKRYISAMKKYPQCFKTLAYHSQLNEATSDMLASLVLEKHFIDNPPANEAVKVGAIDFAHSHCSSGDLVNKLKSGSPMLTAGLLFQFLSGPHPSSTSRVDKIFLNLPGMADVYNCDRTHKGCVDHLSFYKRINKSASSPSGVTK